MTRSRLDIQVDGEGFLKQQLIGAHHALFLQESGELVMHRPGAGYAKSRGKRKSGAVDCIASRSGRDDS